MKGYVRKVFPSVLLASFLGGCVPLSYGIFINAATQRLQVTLVGGGSGEVRAEFYLEPRDRYKTEIGYDNAIVTDTSGHKLFSQVLPLRDPEDKYSKLQRGLFEIGGSVFHHFLVTEHGIYPIPWEYRETWQDHLDAIVRGK